jgi:hypothetical protein
MSYRDTAIELAKRTPGNLVGVVFTRPRPTGKPPSPAAWGAYAFPDLSNMQGWYEEVSSSPSYYYYVAAFDKAHGLDILGETTAPPIPGDPAWAIQFTLRDMGYGWKPNPFRMPSRPTVSGEPSQAVQTWAPIAFIAGMFGLAWFTTSRAVKNLRSGK